MALTLLHFPNPHLQINDGFGGGHTISRNLGFNAVRETSDHSFFNSWNRNTYAWKQGAGGTDPLTTHVHHNLFVANYYSIVGIDNDDGSSAYDNTDNVLLYGGSKNLMGFSKRSEGNAMVYVDYTPGSAAGLSQRVGWSAPEQKPPMCAGYITSFPASTGLADSWLNNTCIATTSASFFRFQACNSSNPLDGSIPVPLAGNHYYSTNASYQMKCGAEVWGLEEVQARGVDVGATLHPLPTTQQLLDMLGSLLQM